MYVWTYLERKERPGHCTKLFYINLMAMLSLHLCKSTNSTHVQDAATANQSRLSGAQNAVIRKRTGISVGLTGEDLAVAEEGTID